MFLSLQTAVAEQAGSRPGSLAARTASSVSGKERERYHATPSPFGLDGRAHDSHDRWTGVSSGCVGVGAAPVHTASLAYTRTGEQEEEEADRRLEHGMDSVGY